jgi:hypothetical protein
MDGMQLTQLQFGTLGLAIAQRTKSSGYQGSKGTHWPRGSQISILETLDHYPLRHILTKQGRGKAVETREHMVKTWFNATVTCRIRLLFTGEYRSSNQAKIGILKVSMVEGY